MGKSSADLAERVCEIERANHRPMNDQEEGGQSMWILKSGAENEVELKEISVGKNLQTILRRRRHRESPLSRLRMQGCTCPDEI